MPRLNMQTPHALGRDEAIRRLKARFDSVRESFGGDVSDLTETWQENVLRFGFKAVGMQVAGTVTVEDSEVNLAAELPLAAMLVRGMIEKRIREELGDLLT